VITALCYKPQGCEFKSVSCLCFEWFVFPLQTAVGRMSKVWPVLKLKSSIFNWCTSRLYDKNVLIIVLLSRVNSYNCFVCLCESISVCVFGGGGGTCVCVTEIYTMGSLSLLTLSLTSAALFICSYYAKMGAYLILFYLTHSALHSSEGHVSIFATCNYEKYYACPH